MASFRDQVRIQTIYLDQMHWIGLAKARLGQPDGARYASAWGALRASVAAGRARVPLCDVHYAEVGGTGSVRQRTDVALTMGVLSRYQTIAPREAVLRSELRHALGRWRGLQIPPLGPDQVFGHGFAFAFGERIGPGEIVGPEEAKANLFSQADAVVDMLEAKIGDGWTYDRLLAGGDGHALVVGAMRAATEFVILRGPRPEDLEELRRDFGYKPETFTDRIKARADRERALAQMLADGTSRKDRIDDIVAGRLFVWELGPALLEALTDLKIPRDDLFESGRVVLDQLLEDMPMMQVEFALRRANFKNGDYPWTTHDMHDIDMLGRAVPYCDVVVTEKHATHQLNLSHLGEKYGTVILRDIQDLVPLLAT